MDIQENILLSEHTTFHIGGLAKYFCEAKTTDELNEALKFAEQKSAQVLIMGGGSNVLVSDKGFDGLVIKLVNEGIEQEDISDSQVRLTIGSGQNWDSVVAFAVEHGLWGIENLSHIPGNTGALTVQNVGAYGQEASQVVESVLVFDRQTHDTKIISRDECEFGYRKSIFNTSEKNRYVILHTNLVLSKVPNPNLSYGDLKIKFADRDPQTITLAEIRSAIIEIRNTKFPFPDAPERGNAGSFFRGPILSDSEFADMQKKVLDLFGTEQAQRLEAMADRLKVPQGYKTPTAFLLDVCGFKGLEVGGAQINPAQPAIILNKTGKASAEDVITLYNQVKAGVLAKTGVELEHEPEFVGFEGRLNVV
ncbi:MAG: UDP-N-acetylmuramate dehydrogenase [Candidatus Doudnabacteria bacterium]|nr:UDP-N-acetylmuramate dehydrogenase [Candidatus Doudnabacteria bacterium]